MFSDLYLNVQPHVAQTSLTSKELFQKSSFPVFPYVIWDLGAVEKSDESHRIDHFWATLGKLLASVCLSFLLCKIGKFICVSKGHAEDEMWDYIYKASRLVWHKANVQIMLILALSF